MRELKQSKTEAAVRGIFPFASAYREKRDEGEVSFSCETAYLSYDLLTRLSGVLGTREIDIRAVDTSGGCPTCGGELDQEISVRGVVWLD